MRFELTTLTLASANRFKSMPYTHFCDTKGEQMANIRRLKSGNWNVQVRVVGKPARSQTFHTKSEALVWAQEQESVLNFQHPDLLSAGLVYCDTVLAERPSERLTRLQIKRFGNRSELSKPLNKLTLQDINSYKLNRLREVSTTTARDDLMMIRRILRWYIGEWMAQAGELLPNPCDRLTLPKARKVRETVISREQLAAMMKIMTPQMAEIIELAYETAMRRSEILRLTKSDLSLDERFLRVVEGKEGSRDVPLTKRAVALLEAAQERVCSQSQPLYPVAAYSVSQALRRARQKLGFSNDIRFHQLRHSRITEVARMGLNQLQIMVVSGHRDIRSVQRYTHLNVRDVVDLID